MGAEQYGEFFWCVGVLPRLLSGQPAESDNEMFLHADTLDVLPDGTLLAVRRRNGDKAEATRQSIFAWAPGTWRYFYAASVMDGSAIAVDSYPRSTAD